MVPARTFFNRAPQLLDIALLRSDVPNCYTNSQPHVSSLVLMDCCLLSLVTSR